MSQQENKPNYRFGIWDKSSKTLVKLKETNKPVLFEYPIQAMKYIEKHLADSPNFCIFDLVKHKKYCQIKEE